MPKQGMGPVRRAQVMGAVIQTVAEQGLEDLTLDAVAARAGVSKGVVNYYFAGKRDLLLKSFQAFLEAYNRQISDRIHMDMSAMDMMGVVIDVCFPEGDVVLPLGRHDPEGDGETPAQSVPALTCSVDQIGRALMHFQTKTLLDEDFQAVYQTVYQTYLEGTKAIVEHGMATGVFRETDPEGAAYGLLALIEGMVLYRNTGFHPMSAESYRRVCRAFARRHLVAREAS